MILLVIISISLFWIDTNEQLKMVISFIWIIFVIDVFVRFIIASAKIKYIKKNPFDIISIIPLDDSFLLARFARLLYLFRMKTILIRYIRPINNHLLNFNFKKISFYVIITLFLFSFAIKYSMNWNYLESIYWVFMNFFKFNYEKSFNNNLVLMFAIFIKLIGITYMGLLLGNILKYLKLKERSDTRDGGNK